MTNLETIKQEINSLDNEDKNRLLMYLAQGDKDNEDIYNSLITKVSTAIPEFENISEVSKVGRLLKIFALMIYEYNHLTYDEFYNNFFIHSASGEYLDEYAKEVGIERHTRAKSRGKIRIGSSKPVIAPVDLPLLFTVSTKETAERPALHFKAVSSATIEPSAKEEDGVYWADKEVMIEAVEGGEIYNLSAGEITEILTKIPSFDKIEHHRQTEGGYDRESDEALRRRIIEQKKTDFELSESWLINKTKEQFGEIDIAVLPTPYGFGTVSLVVNTKDRDVISNIQDYWKSSALDLLDFKVYVSAAELKYIDIKINLYHKTLSVDISLFEKMVFDYMRGLKTGDSFVKSYLEKELVSLCAQEGVIYFTTISPVEDIIEVEKDTKITIDETKNIFTVVKYA